MEQKIRDFYANVMNVKNEDTLNFAVQNSKLIFVKKRTTLFHQGDLINQIYFLCSGFFYCSAQKTPTRKIIHEIAYLPGVSPNSSGKVEKQIAAFDYYVSVDSEFIVIDFDVIEKILKNDKEAYIQYAQILNSCYNQQVMIQKLRSLPAVERVQTFFKEFSSYVSYMSNIEIAAYLDMSRSEYTKAFALSQKK